MDEKKTQRSYVGLKIMRRDWSFEAMQVPGPDDMVAWGALGAWLSDCQRWQVVPGKKIQIEYTSLSRVVEAGEWIIKNGCGGLSAYNDADFRELFVPVILKELDEPGDPE